MLMTDLALASPTATSRVAPRIDVHQHLWPAELLTALGRRRAAPRLRRDAGGWVLESAGEPDWRVDERDHDPARRAGLAREDGTDLVVVAPSNPIGAEALPARAALALADAYHRGVAALPAPFAAWATAALEAPDPAGLDALLADGFAGLCLPAAALATPAGIARLAPLLDVLERRDAPLLVHPGPAPWAPAPALPAGAPAWLPAMTTYVAQMHTAWHALHAGTRSARPALRICFAMLAGLAPLHADRLRLRAGERWGPHPATFLETSSYGPAVQAAVADVAGPGALVHGTDRPVVDPGPEPPPRMRTGNPLRLLGPANPALRRALVPAPSPTRGGSPLTTLAPRPATGLSPAALRALVCDLAGREEAWRPLAVTLPDGRRGAQLLRRDDDVEVWVLTWETGHDTGFHDHGGSAAAVTVVTGQLLEERLTVTGTPALRALAAGQVVDVDPVHVHRIRHVGGPRAVSIHAYSPPLREVGAYAVSGEGLLERTPLPGDHELGED